jgi:hypothetical protein
MKARTGYEMAISGAELRDGDYVELANQWAKVTLSVEVEDGARIFKVSGDVVQFSANGDVRNVRASELAFPSAKDAFNNALASLAYYAKGRVS